MTETRIPTTLDGERLFLVAFLVSAIQRMNDGVRMKCGDAVRYVVPNVSLHGERGDFEIEVQWKRRLQG
jgi:hypothetical protein